ncbi:hypothetical protein Hamer_G014447 [Homarus americanus]|uniref:CUB domain-containing protein n=1 Tax=Homarus americanus TaxID=6706 RepID=A0A8J5MU04_HOMAM|nr:hypothetical protein Hamer_G014447 [Homarus americanus]
MLPDVDYKAAQTRKRIRKKVPNDGGAPEVYLNDRDKFRITTFYTIIDKLETEMRRRGEIYKEIAERFSFLSDVPHNATSSSTEIERYSQCCQKLTDAYLEDFNTNFSAELQQFHLYGVVVVVATMVAGAALAWPITRHENSTIYYMMCGDKLHIILEEKEELIVNFDSDNQTLVEGECLADLRVAVKDTGIKKYGMQVEGEMDLEDPDNGELCTSSYLRVTDVDDLEDETGRINKFCNKDSIDFETIEDLVTLELSLKDIGKNKGQFMVKLMPHCLCGGLIDKTEGEIKTPLYPRPYPNILCIWVIKV